MELTTILLIAVLVLEGTLGAGLILLWRQGRRPPKGKEPEPGAIRGERESLEFDLDSKVDLILAKLQEGLESLSLPQEMRTQAGDSRKKLRSTARDRPSESRVVPDLRPRPPSSGRDLSDAEELELLLESPDFKNGIWPRMDGPFHVAVAHLMSFLTLQGGFEPEIESHPPIGPGYENHWDFMVLGSRDGDDGVVRFLIPRNYSRYDPAMHDHLFRVMGGGESLENFIRELRECAMLRGSGPLEEFIPPKLVERKGVLVV